MQEVKSWEDYFKRLQSFLPKESTRDNLRSKVIPGLDAELKAEEAKLKDLSHEAEVVGNSE